MRKLTVRRNKAFAASAAVMHVFIEDHEQGTMLVNKIPCRRLGMLTNNSEQSFEIDDRSRRLFVVQNPTSKSTYQEAYAIPEGSDDVYVSGRNYFRGLGNPFYFDNNPDAEVVKKRKKSIALTWAAFVGIIIFVALIGVLPTLLKGPLEPKDFTYGDFTITLTSHFKDDGVDQYESQWYYDGTTSVTVFEDTFDDLSESYTLKGYTDLMLDALEDIKVIQEPEIIGSRAELTYKDEQLFGDVIYYTVIIRTKDSFWVAQFIADEEDAERLMSKYEEWANSIKVS